LYVNPDVTVNVSKFRTEADDFLRMVAGEYGPHIQSLTISPAGEIQLPAMTSIHTSGLTIDNLNTLVGARVSERYGNISGSVRLVSTGTQQIFVFGEVQKPGPVSTSRERSILQLVGAAGGPTEFAAMNAVRVLYWDAASIPHIRQANLEKVLESASFEQDMSVPVNSVVYVPPTHLAQAGRMVDQVLRKLFLFQGFSAGIQYNLGTSRINP
jgi:protein involved in polysaccharide export with SLBB domain